MSMTSRSYDQFCGIARALDLVGERWALLVIRDLILGPKRFTDLRRGLPGIGTNVLAARLQELERNGVIERRALPPPAASTVYELTDHGRELEGPLLAVGRWGALSMGARQPGQTLRSEWFGVALKAFFRPDASRPAPDTPPARPPDAKRRALPRPRTGRPPQLVVVSFDGSGGARLWGYWRSVARQAHAHFTFFVSGVYLVDWAHRTRYYPPRHAPGSSDIGFGFPGGELDPAGTLRQIAAAYREGHEIGTHYNGHFCAPYRGNVGEWTAADWGRELDQFDRLLFHGHALPFGLAEVVGGRTPCLQGDLRVLYPVLARHGYRYDASRSAPLGTWPWRERGIWAVPLPEIPLAGHTS